MSKNSNDILKKSFRCSQDILTIMIRFQILVSVFLPDNEKSKRSATSQLDEPAVKRSKLVLHFLIYSPL